MNIDDIEARANAATPGRWEAEPGGAIVWHNSPVTNRAVVALVTDPKTPGAKKDAVFIAAAREDVPAMCAEVRRLRAELADVLAQWQADVGSAIARALTAESQRDAARAEAARLRAALDDVQQCKSGLYYCAWAEKLAKENAALHGTPAPAGGETRP